MTHTWRMSEREMIERAIVRALRRDPVANASHGWCSFVRRIAERIEQNEIVITVVKKNDHR